MAVEFPPDRHREPSIGELYVCSSPIPKPAISPQDEMRANAHNFAIQPLTILKPGVWAVLTAISKVARLRPEGMNMLLFEVEHCIGRSVEDQSFCIKSNSVSACHCVIFRARENHADGKACSNSPMTVFLKDTSTNGTYLNWVKLRRSTPKARLTHGDIISFISPPHDDNSYAFVYREVPSSNGEGSKRKLVILGDFCNESKRLKGIGIGAPDGPVSLDDVRSLQRSNTELRRQLESHILTIEALHKENREMNAHHENELKEQMEAISNSYLDRIKGLIDLLDVRQKELSDVNATSAELQNSIKELNERLYVLLQSRTDADEIINSQKVTISELEAQLDEEKNQRRGEREKAEVDLRTAIKKAHLEAQDEIKRQSDVHLRQHREQQEFITKLQESEKESRLLVEMQRSKLEDARESLVTSEKKSRQLEAQFQDEVLNSTKIKEKLVAAESELKKLRKELDNEKVAREEAWAKVSSLELEIAAAIRDLSTEKQKFQGARERIILRETQLRAFYTTTEEISSLFSKQQEQLKAMQKTLEDEENYENSLFAVDLNVPPDLYFIMPCPTKNSKESSGASNPKNPHARTGSINDMTDNDDDSSTQKHDYQNGSQDGNSQGLEGGSFDGLVRGFDSDVNVDGATTVPQFDQMDTERILGSESQVGDTFLDERSAALLKCSNLAGETVQIDDDDGAKDNNELQTDDSDIKIRPMSRRVDNEASTIRTADLLASEAAGSWAVDTAPSVHGENESPEGHGLGAPHVRGSPDGKKAGSNTSLGITKLTKEHQALSAMISIVEPDFKQKFRAGVAESESTSDAETQEGSNHSNGGVIDDDDDSVGDSSEVEATNGVDVMIEDSVG